jgi:hypothetical protein
MLKDVLSVAEGRNRACDYTMSLANAFKCSNAQLEGVAIGYVLHGQVLAMASLARILKSSLPRLGCAST